MEVKDFLRMGDDYEHIDIVRYDRTTTPATTEYLYRGTTGRYFKEKQQPNGTIKSWYNDIEARVNIMTIEIE